jgi:predicted metalloprotease with PDZ domain
MSRSSPGRYALHEFSKNVYDVVIQDGGGRMVSVTRPDNHQWRVSGHDGTVRVRYTVFGDHLDGTYLAIDATHAHINIPAALMWARGLEDRPAWVQVDPPPASDWRVATQLMPAQDGLTFTAPNLQYLMDSPMEVSRLTIRDFTVEAGTSRGQFRLALHHEGTDEEARSLAADLEKIAAEEAAIFGEFPAYDNARYIFLADVLPWARSDAMEHRNSTIITVPGSLAEPSARNEALDSAAHELFHAWSVERIRPRSLEPFDFTRANMSADLWFAEGVTSYYTVLVLHRAGLESLEEAADELADLINRTTLSPGRRFRSAEDMSRFAPLVDEARSVDRTNVGNTFISYYTWGAALGLGLDLALRDRTDGRVTLDDFMRDLWTTFGKEGQDRPGYVSRPYSSDDLVARLALVSGDQAFANDFIARYVRGREVPDYARLLARAGLTLEPRSPKTPWIGDIRLAYGSDGARVDAPTTIDSPAYRAGLDRDDVLVSLDGEAMTDGGRLASVLGRHAAGDVVPVVYLRRGRRVAASLTLEADPRQRLVPIESTGGSPTAAQRKFREDWLRSRRR